MLAFAGGRGRPEDHPAAAPPGSDAAAALGANASLAGPGSSKVVLDLREIAVGAAPGDAAAAGLPPSTKPGLYVSALELDYATGAFRHFMRRAGAGGGGGAGAGAGAGARAP